MRGRRLPHSPTSGHVRPPSAVARASTVRLTPGALPIGTALVLVTLWLIGSLVDAAGSSERSEITDRGAPHTRGVIVPRPVYRAIWALHRGLRRLSGGRIGTRAARDDSVGTLFLHTVGHRTGQPRVNGLYYLQEGGNLLVVASNAGADRDPAWWLNLRDHPHAEVEIGGRRRPVRARQATTDEAARIIPRLDRANPEFATYRARVTRSIPIVILEPR